MANTTPGRSQLAGGFLPPTAQQSQTLPSPAPSTASSRAAARLPAPRSKPLVPGSRKEDYAREYVAQRLLHVSRRFVKKHGIPETTVTRIDYAEDGGEEAEEDENQEKKDEKGEGIRGAKGGDKEKKKEQEVPGYESADQMCADLEEVVDVLWFSGTPSLQIPYLINVASALTTYLPSFRPPSPRPTFALLQKLDHCFASLLIGRDVKTRDPLPSFRSQPHTTTPASVARLGLGLSRTDMVRVKSIADETRMLVAVAMSGEADVEDDAGEEEDEEDYNDNAVKRLKRRARASGRDGDGDNDDDKILDPFEAQIDPGEGVVYRLKPEDGDYGGFVADEDTDDDDEEEDDFAAAGAGVNIKREDINDQGKKGEGEGEGEDGNEDEDDEFIDVAQPKIIPKRKVDDDDVDISEQEAEENDPKKRAKVKVETPKDQKVSVSGTGGGDDDSGLHDNNGTTGHHRIKVEEEDDDERDTPILDLPFSDSELNNGSRAPPRPAGTIAALLPPSNNITSTNSGTATPQRQFHFALDEDEDDDDDDSGGETLPNTTTNTSSAPANGNGQQQQQQRQQRQRNYGEDNYIDEEDEEEEEEEEELHMNVAKVYEKTLTQLGKLLGQSIVVGDNL